MLGELLLDLDEPALASSAFEQSLKADPDRFRSLYGAARAAELAGDRVKAAKFYSQLLQQADPQASDRKEIVHARTFIAKL